MSGALPWFGANPGGANLAGLVWAGELARATGDDRYSRLIVDVAERYRPGEGDGAPSPCDPDFRTEDMFMAGAMLGRAFRQTGEARHLELLTKFLLDSNIQQGKRPLLGTAVPGLSSGAGATVSPPWA